MRTHGWALLMMLALGGCSLARQDALFDVASHGAAAQIEHALVRGAALNARDHNDMTALMIAAQSNNLPAVRSLIKAGADVNASTWAGQTALGLSGNSRAEVAEALLDAGADVNAQSLGGMTPLSQAAFQGNSTLVRLLMGRGADVNLHGFGTPSPLELAELKHDAEVAELLRQAGAYS